MGNLTKDPELKTLPSGSSVSNFGIATNRVWKNQQGEKQEEVQFHNIVVFGKQADTVSQYLKKGSSVLVEVPVADKELGRSRRNKEKQDGDSGGKSPVWARRQAGGFAGKEETGAVKGNAKQEEPLETIEYPEEDIKPEEIPF